MCHGPRLQLSGGRIAAMVAAIAFVAVSAGRGWPDQPRLAAEADPPAQDHTGPEGA